MTEQAGVAGGESVARQLPGSFLREAREAQGLSLAEVAGALKFSVRQIEALENDNHEHLQGKTFLRGFIRAYARMLKLQPEPLLEMLESESVEPVEQIIPPDNMGETNPVPFYRRHVKVILTVIASCIVVAGVAWLYNEKPLNEDKPINNAQLSTSAFPVSQEAGQPADSSPAEALSAVASVSGTAVQPLSPPVLSFDLRDLSWLEVRDGNGQVLLTGEFPAGQKQIAAGKPPYQVWIGKTSVVQLVYKGQPVDLQPYTHDEVARLTLDK